MPETSCSELNLAFIHPSSESDLFAPRAVSAVSLRTFVSGCASVNGTRPSRFGRTLRTLGRSWSLRSGASRSINIGFLCTFSCVGVSLILSVIGMPTNSVNEPCAFNPRPSSACMTILNTPGVVGRPEMTPFSKVKPGGSGEMTE